MKTNIVLILSAFVWTQFLTGQQFSFVSINPFGLEYQKQDSIEFAVKLIFNDIDADGDQDVIILGVKHEVTFQNQTYSSIKYFIDKQINTGTKLQPVFLPREPFMHEFPYPDGLFAPAAGDLNLDGKLDFIICCGVDFSLNLKPQYYERKSIAGNDQFNIIDSDSLLLRNFSRGGIFIPELADMDMDGDLDLLLSGFQSLMVDNYRRDRKYLYLYAKNIGTLSQPKFDGWYHNPYGLIPAEDIQYSIIGDIDNDNDNDILSLFQQDTIGLFSFMENIPQSNGKPTFLAGVHSPFGLPVPKRGDTFFGHSLVDIDGDGDLDLFVIQDLVSTGTGIGYYENNLCQSNSIHLIQDICEGDSLTIGNQVLKTTGEYFISFENIQHCDSTVHVSLNVNNLNQQNFEEVICDGESYIVGNQIFTQTGNYTIALINSNGCDSIINLSLMVRPMTSIGLSTSICGGETYVLGDQTFNQSGQYQVTLSSIHGCDSIINLNLTVFPIEHTTLTESLCEGASFTLGTQTFQQSGQYEVILTNSAGCDSIINLNLNVFPKSTTNLNSSICQGAEINIGNQSFNQTGQYEVSLINSNGCDSIVNLDLIVHPVFISNLIKSLCSGSTFIIGNQSFTQSGQYEVKLNTINGCDSIVNATLTFVVLNDAVTQTQNNLTSNQNDANYQWFDCIDNTDIAGATSQTFIPTKNGKYGVRITDNNNCQITSACYDFVLSGIEVLILSNRIILFPNPAADNFTILNNTGYTLTGVKIINSTGITERILPNYQIERISTARLSQGMYIIEMECNGMKIYKKLAVNKN